MTTSAACDIVYDVIVVGGGPMGLSAAYQCVKEGRKVMIIEQYKFGNEHGSSPGFGRQFRTCYSESYLCELAIISSTLWDELMAELNDNSLLNRTGCLWFGDGTVESSEGNIDKAVENLKGLRQDFTLIQGKEAIQNDKRFSFISQAVNEIDYPKGLYLDDGGTINVPALINSLLRKLKEKETDLLQNTNVKCIDYTSQDEVVLTVVTDLKPDQYIHAKKVILTPGTYANDILSTLTPVFTKRINLTIYLWSSTYFKSEAAPSNLSGSQSESSEWPIWYFFGQPKDSHNDVHDLNVYYGFPSETTRPEYARVAPGFTSSQRFDFKLYPPPSDDRPLDSDALGFTSAFVKRSMPSLSPALIDAEHSTCIAGFADLADDNNKEDQGAGFGLDFLPGEGINKRLVLFTGGWGMKFVPVIGKILADLAIKGYTDETYTRLIQPMNINRGVLVEESRTSDMTCNLL